MSTVVTHDASPVTLGGSVQARTWSATDAAFHDGYDGTYWLNPYGTLASGDTTPTNVSAGWNRITVTARGYDTAYVYRNHQYVTTGSLQATSVPYSAGPYPIPLTFSFPSPTVRAAEEDFSLWKKPLPAAVFTLFNHPKLPDLILDPRSLLQVQQVLAGCGPAFPDHGGRCSSSSDSSLTSNTKQCLTFSANFANAGSDNFELYADPGPGRIVPITASTVVQQVIYSTDSSHQMVPTTGEILSGGPGGFAEVQDFARFDLRGPIVAGVCDTEATASACPIVSLDHGTVGPSAKDVCLGDNVYQFDPIYGPGRPGLRGLNCVMNSTSSIADVGIQAGFSEMYPVGQDCNFLDVSNVQPGKYWLEGEVNPPDGIGHRAYQESDYSNNISRSLVAIAAQATCPCGNGMSSPHDENNCLF